MNMVHVFESQTFECFYDDGDQLFEDIEFRRCNFESCAISITHDPRHRSTVHNVKVIDGVQRGCAINSAIVEDVLIDGLKTNGVFQALGAVFKRVTLRGKLGRIMLASAVPGLNESREDLRPLELANIDYYATVDWALDISEAQAEEIDIRRVPARLIRRDPATQVVITREKAMQGKWRTLDLSETHWATSLEYFLKEGDPDVVLVAPRSHRKFRQLHDGLNALRDAGVAEPN
jgi:hypothetical protein